MSTTWTIASIFVASLIPTVTSIIGIVLNHGLREEMRAGFLDVKNQIAHLIDLHIDHAERIAILENPKKP